MLYFYILRTRGYFHLGCLGGKLALNGRKISFWKPMQKLWHVDFIAWSICSHVWCSMLIYCPFHNVGLNIKTSLTPHMWHLYSKNIQIHETHVLHCTTLHIWICTTKANVLLITLGVSGMGFTLLLANFIKTNKFWVNCLWIQTIVYPPVYPTHY